MQCLDMIIECKRHLFNINYITCKIYICAERSFFMNVKKDWMFILQEIVIDQAILNIYFHYLTYMGQTGLIEYANINVVTVSVKTLST